MLINVDYLANTPLVDLIPTGLKLVYPVGGCVEIQQEQWDVASGFYLIYQKCRWEILFLCGEIIYVSRVFWKDDMEHRESWNADWIPLDRVRVFVYDLFEKDFIEPSLNKTLGILEEECRQENPNEVKYQTQVLEILRRYSRN